MNSPCLDCGAFLLIRLLFWFSYLLWIFPISASDHGHHRYGQDYNGGLNATNGTVLHEEHRSQTCECGGRIAGAVIASLLCGLVLGAALMYLYFKKFAPTSKIPPLPKDYDLPENRLDVNRNDEPRYDSSPQTTAADGLSGNNVKIHKKLQRLVNKPAQKSQALVEIPSAAMPLIHVYESTGEDNHAVTTTPSGTKSFVSGSDDLYSNIGDEGALNQPYESLDIIPEEVEYENSVINNYEQMT